MRSISFAVLVVLVGAELGMADIEDARICGVVCWEEARTKSSAYVKFRRSRWKDGGRPWNRPQGRARTGVFARARASRGCFRTWGRSRPCRPSTCSDPVLGVQNRGAGGSTASGTAVSTCGHNPARVGAPEHEGAHAPFCAPQHQSSAGRVRAARGRPSVSRGVRGWVAHTTTRCGSWVDLGGLVREATGSQAQ